MLPFWDLTKIEEIRRRLGLTQQELAKYAGVSQSIIAKIERGRINPSFEVVRRIYMAFERIKSQREKVKARDICTREVKMLDVNDELSKAIHMMREFDISQLPVFDGEHPVGSISESTIAKKLDRITSLKIRVKELMEESFPIIPEETSISLVREILLEYPAVLLQRNGRITGIITKADILKVFEA